VNAPIVGDDSNDDGSVTVSVSIDGELAGEIVMEDPVRENALETIREIRRLGIARIILATGDREPIALRIASALQLDVVHSQLAPSHKADLVAMEKSGGPLMMVGDGVNDAPALAAADVGVAMGARGSVASTETADAVVLVDDIRPLARGIAVAKRTLSIAQQSVWAGLGLSMAGMIAAALGYLPPVQGALLQELIDVAVIFNALRALR
jgi:P-type E1-E2 ATPase